MPPAMGSDTASVLRDVVGLSAVEIDRLAAAGIVGLQEA
jgi:hypothetical protein